MKKFLLSVAVMVMALAGTAQVICYVEPPSTNSGIYDFTYATVANGWGVNDLTIPANSVNGFMAFATDATAADSLACNAVTSDVNGKIAVLYRGSCEFGLKALNAQTAGAIAVIIINNVPGAPQGMLAGASGASVTIPVVMVSDATGALLKAEIEAGTSTAFIGSKTGNYPYDLGFYNKHVLRAEHFGNLQALSQNASEFEVELGGWVVNYGSQPQTNVVLSCTVMLGASTLYTESSIPQPNIAVGDSAFIALPTFTQTSYANGYYDIQYVITSDNTDEFPFDNTIEADFMMSDSLFSYSRIDETTFKPVNQSYYRGGSTLTSNATCVAFSDPNASRMAFDGMTVSMATDTTLLTGELIEIYAYEWDDAFTDFTDATITDLNEMTKGEYIYDDDIQQQNIYVPFDDQLLMEDDRNYLFCIAYYSVHLFTGFDLGMDYNWNLETYIQPMFPGEADGTWFLGGFGTDVVPALTVNMFTAQVGLVELPKSDLVAYPNPASESITIPMPTCDGNVVVNVIDITGKIISTLNAALVSSALTIDVTTLPTGVYTMNLTFEDGTTNDVQVVVNR
jgi:hypothetical protein